MYTLQIYKDTKERRNIYQNPLTRGLAQHGGLPGWLEESDPAGVILCVMDGPYRLPFPYRTGCPELSSCQLMEFPAAVM